MQLTVWSQCEAESLRRSHCFPFGSLLLEYHLNVSISVLQVALKSNSLLLHQESTEKYAEGGLACEGEG